MLNSDASFTQPAFIYSLCPRYPAEPLMRESRHPRAAQQLPLPSPQTSAQLTQRGCVLLSTVVAAANSLRRGSRQALWCPVSTAAEQPACPEQLGVQALGHTSLIQAQSAESPAVCQPTTLLPFACRLWASTLGWVQRLTTHVCRMRAILALLHPTSTLSTCSVPDGGTSPPPSTITSV